MKTYLHPALSLSQRALPVSGRLRMALTMSLGFALCAPRGGQLLPAGEAWAAAMNALAPGDVIDMGVPKFRSEWLMAGSACAPRGTLVRGLPVGVRLGELARDFLVSGECEDDGVTAPSPRPFERMPLVWSNAYGGPEHPENPQGRGMFPEKGRISLPTLMGRDEPLRPACPGPRLPGIAEGTYDEAWLQTRWPGVPDDFDWAYYNLAQTEQRQETPFSCLESLRITNMHPDRPLMEGGLPGVRLRLFLDYGTQGRADWREVEAELDTVWLFPNDNTGMLFWHAVAPTADERGLDIARIAASLEPADAERRPAPICILECLAAEENAPEEATAEPEKKPEEMPAPPDIPLAVAPDIPSIAVPESLPDVPELPELPEVPQRPLWDFSSSEDKMMVASVVAETNALLAARGLPLLDEADVFAQLDKQRDTLDLLAEAAQAEPSSPEEMLVQAGLSPEDARSILELASLEPPLPEQFPSKEAYEAALDQFMGRYAELSGASPEQQALLLSGLRLMDEPAADKLARENAGGGISLEILQEAGLSPKEAADWVKALSIPAPETGSDADILSYLHAFESAAGLPKGLMAGQMLSTFATIRKNLYSGDEAVKAVRALAEESPADAEGLSKLASLLESLSAQEGEDAADMGTEASGGLFDLALLARKCGVFGPAALAALTAMDPMPMRFPAPEAVESLPPEDVPAEPIDTPEPEAKPEKAPLPEPAPMPEVTDKASFINALRDGMDLTGCDLSGLDLSGLRLSEHGLAGADLSGLILDGANLSDADLSGCSLASAQLSGVFLAGARLVQAGLAGANLAGSCLNGTDLTDADCSGADFTGATISRASLRGAVCAGAVFDRAVLHGNDYRGCALNGAGFNDARLNGECLEHVDLDEAVFSRTELAGTRLHGTLRSATFENCLMERADLSSSSLLGARLYDSDLTGARLCDADCSGSNWLRVHGPRADLRNAVFTNATLEECVMPELRAACLSARGCLWLSCDLRLASFPRLDLFRGALRGCRLGGADLSGASLFEADLYLSEFTDKTSLLGADLTRTCLTRGVSS